MTQILVLLLQVVMSFIAYFAWIRFLLEWGQAPINNIFTQQIIKIFAPTLKVVQRIIGTYKHTNFSVLLIILLLNIINIVIFLLITTHSFPDIGGLLLWAAINMILQCSQIIFFGTIIYALMSWFPNLLQSPLGSCIYAVINPIVNIFRKIIPSIGIFDLSALAVLLSIYVLRFLLSPLLMKAMALALA